MRNISITIILIAFSITCGYETSATPTPQIGNDIELSEAAEKTFSNIDKRLERYAFGLGRRAYTYTSGGGSGVKRLPVYNFGLGKRARPYSFGLGKRSELFDINRDYQEIDNDDGNDNENYYGYSPPLYESIKRNRPYSFGLGKRDGHDSIMPYNFGMGKREFKDEQLLQNHLMNKREINAPPYNFGLGKREVKDDQNIPNHLMNKREINAPPYSFGLGKREVKVTFDDGMLNR